MTETPILSIAEDADRAARRAVETNTPATNPHLPGGADHGEWHRRYCCSFLRHSSSHPEGEISA